MGGCLTHRRIFGPQVARSLNATVPFRVPRTLRLAVFVSWWISISATSWETRVSGSPSSVKTGAAVWVIRVMTDPPGARGTNRGEPGGFVDEQCDLRSPEQDGGVPGAQDRRGRLRVRRGAVGAVEELLGPVHDEHVASIPPLRGGGPW